MLPALLAPFLTADPLAQNLAARNAPPAAAHLLGTDALGRDVLSRLGAGAGLSLILGFGAMTGSLLLGAGLGLASLAAGKTAEAALFAVFDLIRAMPSVLLALTLLMAIGNGLAPIILALSIAYAPMMAAVARGAWQREQQALYVAAATATGAPPWRILQRHILPNVAGALATQAAIVVPRAITTESVLSFFGLGVSPETPTWGRMIAAGAAYVETAPMPVLAPVIALSLTTLACALFGDRLRLALDPLRHAR